MTKESKSITDYFKDKVVKEFAIKSTIFIGFIIGLRTFLLYFSYTNFFKSNFSMPNNITNNATNIGFVLTIIDPTMDEVF